MGFRDIARKRRDEYESDAKPKQDAPLMCAANACPARASVFADGDRGLCSWHHAAAPREWPRVTEEVREHLAREREKRLMAEIPMEHEERRPADVAAIKEKLRKQIAALGSTGKGIEWALRLREIDENPDLTLPHGKRLTPAQRDMYRTALQNRGILGGKEGHEPA